MRSTVILMLSLLLSCMACLIAPPVHSCTCGNWYQSDLEFPAPDELLPLNGRVWIPLYYDDEGTFGLLDAAGEEVPSTFSLIERAQMPLGVVTPDSDLQPDSSYQLVWCDDRGCNPPFGEIHTGAARDDDVPPLPDVTVTGKFQMHYDYCGPDAGVSFQAEFEGLLLIDLNADSAFNAETMSGEVDVVTMEEAFTLDVSGCIPVLPAGGGNVAFRFGALDAAGNFSGWTPVQTIFVPEKPMCQVVTPGRPSASLLSMILQFLFRTQP